MRSAFERTCGECGCDHLFAVQRNEPLHDVRHAVLHGVVTDGEHLRRSLAQSTRKRSVGVRPGSLAGATCLLSWGNWPRRRVNEP